MVSLSFLSLASNAGLPVEWPEHRRTGMARSTLPGLFPESGGRLGGNAHRGSFERPSAEPTFPPVIIYWYISGFPPPKRWCCAEVLIVFRRYQERPCFWSRLKFWRTAAKQELGTWD